MMAIVKDKAKEVYDAILNGAALWGAFYRENPDIFARDYLHLDLKIFQKIELVEMLKSTVVIIIGARGIGKTFISAIFCVIKCILYPGTVICIASGTRGQAAAVIEKIALTLKPLSEELQNEINEKESRYTGQDVRIVFKNTSVIKVVTARDTARGNRATVLILDEFRMIKKDDIDTVLKKFLTLRRMPPYSELTKAERFAEYSKEKSMTMYLSSAYWKDHWSYAKCEEVFAQMLNDHKRQFICGHPYQLSIEEGLLDPDLIADEMAETDFNEIKFSMEYSALFFGSGEDSFFDFESISKNRRIQTPYLPERLIRGLPNNTVMRIPQKKPGEIRILSADIALMSSKKNNNDATAVFINQMMPTKSGRYMSNIVYSEVSEGLHTEDQALAIRRLYDEYECDYIVLDTNGIGLGVFDCLVRDIVDPDTGEIYPAISCINDKVMADRCIVPGADRVIWSVKASAQFNSDCAFYLREGFRSGKIRLLITEYDADLILEKLSGFSKLEPEEKERIRNVYVNTTLLVDEMIKLQYEESAGKVKLFERTGMRKDRYSSLSYNYYVALQIENKKQKSAARSSYHDEDFFLYRAPKIK